MPKLEYNFNISDIIANLTGKVIVKVILKHSLPQNNLIISPRFYKDKVYHSSLCYMTTLLNKQWPNLRDYRIRGTARPFIVSWWGPRTLYCQFTLFLFSFHFCYFSNLSQNLNIWNIDKFAYWIMLKKGLWKKLMRQGFVKPSQVVHILYISTFAFCITKYNMVSPTTEFFISFLE